MGGGSIRIKQGQGVEERKSEIARPCFHCTESIFVDASTSTAEIYLLEEVQEAMKVAKAFSQ